MGRIGSDCPRSSGNNPKHQYLLGAYGTRDELRRWLLTGLIGPIVTSPAGAWEQDDRSNYNNKMALLGVLLEGAKQRVQENGDIETLCLLLSIETDITANYVNSAPNNQQINQRLVAMNRDRNMCFSMLEKTALKP